MVVSLLLSAARRRNMEGAGRPARLLDAAALSFPGVPANSSAPDEIRRVDAGLNISWGSLSQ
jgi:hypothetical protein